MGLVTEIRPPDMETRIAILLNISETMNMQIPDEVIQYIASGENSDVRCLEGMLIRLGAFSTIQNSPITLHMAKENLRDIIVDVSDCACRIGEQCSGSRQSASADRVADMRVKRPWVCCDLNWRYHENSRD